MVFLGVSGKLQTQYTVDDCDQIANYTECGSAILLFQFPSLNWHVCHRYITTELAKINWQHARPAYLHKTHMSVCTIHASNV